MFPEEPRRVLGKSRCGSTCLVPGLETEDSFLEGVLGGVLEDAWGCGQEKLVAKPAEGQWLEETCRCCELSGSKTMADSRRGHQRRRAGTRARKASLAWMKAWILHCRFRWSPGLLVHTGREPQEWCWAHGKGGGTRKPDLPPCLARPGHMSSSGICHLRREDLTRMMGSGHDMGEEAGNLLPHSPGRPAPNRLRGPGAAGVLFLPPSPEFFRAEKFIGSRGASRNLVGKSGQLI